MQAPAPKKISKRFWVKLISAPILMFVFAYALVPIYDVICDVTGFNGKTGRVQDEANYQADPKRKPINISFFAATMAGFPVQFAPEVKAMEVIPGKFYTTNYIATNNTDEVVVGQATPSVAPTDAAAHFKKIECFCFTKQIFKPGETVKMALRFVVEPELNHNIRDISLSYNFFRIQPEEQGEI